MKAQSLVKAIISRGGTAEIKVIKTNYGERRDVIGELKDHDIEMHVSDYSGGSDYYTVRHKNKRGHYDPYADYNTGDWTFCHRLKDLDWAIR